MRDTTRRNYGEEVAMFVAILLFALFLLAWSFIADRIREQNNTQINPETWAAFQNCIDPHPSDAVCDSCWKAIIENKHTNN